MATGEPPPSRHPWHPCFPAALLGGGLRAGTRQLLMLICLAVVLLRVERSCASKLPDEGPGLLAIPARSLEPTADSTPSVARCGAYRRLKADPMLRCGRRLGALRRRQATATT